MEELQVEPMKHDFHFYAQDNYNTIKAECQTQLDNDQSTSTTDDKSKQLYLLTTILNARLIQNWENATPATRAEYMKREEADRKRFMSEEEIASRHCATLTARKRSPKSGGTLASTTSAALKNVNMKRPAGGKADGAGSAKKIKV